MPDIGDTFLQNTTFYAVKHNHSVVAIFSCLQKAVNLCSRRHYYVKHGVWRNSGNEMTFDDFIIMSFTIDTYPMKSSIVQYSFVPETFYAVDIEQRLMEKQKVMERADTAEKSLRAIENVLCKERGTCWDLQDREIDMMILLEDAIYEQSVYDPYDYQNNL